MLATVHSALTGWDVIVALVVLLAAVVLEHLIPPIPWVAWVTLFGVFLFGLALTVRF